MRRLSSTSPPFFIPPTSSPLSVCLSSFFSASAAYLTGLDLPQEEIDSSIIGAIGDMDGPMPADSKGWTSLRRHLMGHTDEARQRFRDEVSVCCCRCCCCCALQYVAFQAGEAFLYGSAGLQASAALLFFAPTCAVRASFVLQSSSPNCRCFVGHRQSYGSRDRLPFMCSTIRRSFSPTRHETTCPPLPVHVLVMVADQVLGTKLEDFVEFGKRLEGVSVRGATVHRPCADSIRGPSVIPCDRYLVHEDHRSPPKSSLVIP